MIIFLSFWIYDLGRSFLFSFTCVQVLSRNRVGHDFSNGEKTNVAQELRTFVSRRREFLGERNECIFTALLLLQLLLVYYTTIVYYYHRKHAYLQVCVCKVKEAGNFLFPSFAARRWMRAKKILQTTATQTFQTAVCIIIIISSPSFIIWSRKTVAF